MDDNKAGKDDTEDCGDDKEDDKNNTAMIQLIAKMRKRQRLTT